MDMGISASNNCVLQIINGTFAQIYRMNPKVLAAASVTPKHSENTEDIIKYVERWIANQDERTQKRFIKVFKNARVSRRYSIMSIDEVFTTMTFEERKNPIIIDGSRRSRISKGSGRTVQEINQLLKQFTEMKKMMKKMGKMKLPKNLKNQMLGLN